MTYVKSDLFIPNPQIFLRLEPFFYFFLIFEMIFSETDVSKSRFLTSRRFLIVQVRWVNRTHRNRIWRYFRNPSIFSIFFRFFKFFPKSHKVKICLTGYAIMTLMVFLNFQKFKKHRNYRRIAKILADSVSAGPIYPKHLKNRKSETKKFSVKIGKVTQVFVVLSIFDWSPI